MDTVVVPKKTFERMQKEIQTLRNSILYKRLLEFEQNIQKKKFTRADVGF